MDERGISGSSTVKSSVSENGVESLEVGTNVLYAAGNKMYTAVVLKRKENGKYQLYNENAQRKVVERSIDDIIVVDAT